MAASLYVRYGRMSAVGRFVLRAGDLDLRRGDLVVVATKRGTELGEVLAQAAEEVKPREDVGVGEIVRRADEADLEHASRVVSESRGRFEICGRLFEDGLWPLALIDVEPLLDPGRTVVYYFGPHGLDVEGLREAARLACGLDLVLEPVGNDLPWEEPPEEFEDTCGSCREGVGGGCDRSSDAGACTGCALNTRAGV